MNISKLNLKNGDICICRDPHYKYVVWNSMLERYGGYMRIMRYNDDMVHYFQHKFDIIRVVRPPKSFQLQDIYLLKKGDYSIESVLAKIKAYKNLINMRDFI